MSGRGLGPGGGGLVTSRAAKVFRDGLNDHFMPSLHVGDIPPADIADPFRKLILSKSMHFTIDTEVFPRGNCTADRSVPITMLHFNLNTGRFHDDLYSRAYNIGGYVSIPLIRDSEKRQRIVVKYGGQRLSFGFWRSFCISALR